MKTDRNYDSYIISLVGSTRRAKFQKNIKCHFPESKIFDAFDGRNGISNANILKKTKYLPSYIGREIGDAEVACLVSHLAIYEELVNSDREFAVIFEDDAVVSKYLPPFIDAVLADGFAFDIISFYSGLCCTKSKRKYFQVFDDKLAILPVIGRMDGAVSYVISKAAAKKILDANSNYYQGLADWPIELSSMEVYLTEVNLVELDAVSSSIEASRKNKQAFVSIMKSLLSSSLLSLSLKPFKTLIYYYILPSVLRKVNIKSFKIVMHKDLI